MIFNKNKVRYDLLSVMAVLLMVTSVGCNSILTQDPNFEISSTAFFQNEAEINQAVLGAYAMLQPMYEDQYKFTEVISDNTITQYNDANRGPHYIWFIDQFVLKPSNVELEPYWREVYQGIQRCNTVLNHIDEVKFSNKEKGDQLKGEAEFLRAFYYFDLVRLFGEVPLVLTQTQSVNEAFSTSKKRSSVDSVYNQIIQDATSAAKLLPESYSSDNIGRATKGAAQTLLGIVYLTRHNYSNALIQFKKVMNLEYSLLSDYADVFSPEHKNSKESIFEVQYVALDDNKGLGSNFIYNFAPFNSGTKITGDNAHHPQGLNIPTHSIYNAYEAGDKRKEASIGYFVDPDNTRFGIAMHDTLLYAKKFAHPHSVYGVTNDDWPVYRYSEVLLMTAEVINEIDGPTGEAYDYINQVRHRAGLNPLTPGLSQSEFRKAVYHEERVELAFENHRWFNLLRTGRAIEVMTKHGERVKDKQTHMVEPVYVIEKYKLLFPVPKRLITLNPSVQQNPGY